MIESSITQYHEDDRAQRLLNIFDIPNAQINVSYVNSTKHIVAWHVHQIQTDYFACLKGSFKVGLAVPLYDDSGNRTSYQVKWEFLSDRYPKTIKIPPGVYHGYRALEPNSIMLYYLTEKYNPEDELRAHPGHFGESWGTEDK